MKITTQRITAGKWDLIADDQVTGLTIERSPAAKFGQVQEWDLCMGEEILFTCKGKRGVLYAIEELLTAFGISQ